MAWHNIKQVQELTGKSRSTLYRDMNAGRLSYRTELDGRRVIDTAELIRVYGDLKQSETAGRDTQRQGDDTQSGIAELVQEMRALRLEVAGLKAELQEVRRLEHKPDASPENNPEPKAESQVQRGASWWRKLWG